MVMATTNRCVFLLRVSVTEFMEPPLSYRSVTYSVHSSSKVLLYSTLRSIGRVITASDAVAWRGATKKMRDTPFGANQHKWDYRLCYRV